MRWHRLRSRSRSRPLPSAGSSRPAPTGPPRTRSHHGAVLTDHTETSSLTHATAPDRPAHRLHLHRRPLQGTSTTARSTSTRRTTSRPTSRPTTTAASTRCGTTTCCRWRRPPDRRRTTAVALDVSQRAMGRQGDVGSRRRPQGRHVLPVLPGDGPPGRLPHRRRDVDEPDRAVQRPTRSRSRAATRSTPPCSPTTTARRTCSSAGSRAASCRTTATTSRPRSASCRRRASPRSVRASSR